MTTATSSQEAVLRYIESQFESEASDGLPIFPPTTEAVEQLVHETGLDGELVLGSFPPSSAMVTVRDVAVNGIMAGCKPEYGPVLIATVEALIDPAFDLVGVATSTKGSAPLVIVNGPVRNALGINSRGNVFGHGFRANATIGRAVRLLILNVGRSIPNALDRGTLGHPGRFSSCIAEDEENSPWIPLHVERGFEVSDSTVTVFGGEALRLVNIHYNTPEAVLAGVVDTLATTGVLNDHNITRRSPHVLVFAQEHRDLFDSAGWTKELIREYVAEHAVIEPERLRKAGSQADSPVPMVEGPDDLSIVAAGGRAGRFAGVICGWSWQSQPVTRRIRWDDR